MNAAPLGIVLPRIGLGLSIVIFALPGLVLWLTTAFMLPALVARGWHPLLAWFAAGTIVVAPLLIAAIVGAGMSVGWSARPIVAHLRIRSLTVRQARITVLTLVATLVAVAVLNAVNAAYWPRQLPHPTFMKVEALEPAQYYILAVWLPFFALNIIGEEAFWRGFVQPRQEPVFGEYTWIAQGLLHGAMHISFGGGVLFLLIPVVFAIPWAVQRTKNTTAGIVIHAGVNGPGFLAVSLGLLPV
jgi:membrane protease YdiL (CAAX protease family)